MGRLTVMEAVVRIPLADVTHKRRQCATVVVGSKNCKDGWSM